MGPRQHTYLASKRGRHWRIVVGWDNPLKTYFAQVWDGGGPGQGATSGPTHTRTNGER